MVINNNAINISLSDSDIKALDKAFTLIGMVASALDDDEALVDTTTGECVECCELSRTRGIIDMIRNGQDKYYIKN